MRQHAKRVALLAGLAAAASILAACRPIQVAPVETARPTAAAAATDSIVAAAPDPATDAAPAATPGGELVTLTLAKQGDKSTLGVKDGSLWIDIESASGIGSASVTWTVTPTTPLILRLHLRGLEELRLANGDVETVASVSSSLPHTVRQSTRSGQDAELQPITEGDAAWLGISWSAGGPDKVADGTTKDTPAATAAFPLQDGYFDIVLSDPLLTVPGTSLEIRWIDFYR